MDNELEKLLRDNLEVSKDNNHTLRKILRHERIGKVFSLIHWTIIIGSAIGIYYVLQPYIDVLKEAYVTWQSLLADPSQYINIQ